MTKKIITTLFLIIISVAAFASTNELPPNCHPQTDENYRKLITGMWIGEEEFSLLFKTYVGKTYYNKDGTFIGIMSNKENPNEILVTIKGNWKIKDGKIYEYNGQFEPDVIPMPTESVDTLQCANENYFQSQADDAVILKFHKVEAHTFSFIK